MFLTTKLCNIQLSYEAVEQLPTVICCDANRFMFAINHKEITLESSKSTNLSAISRTLAYYTVSHAE